MMTSHSSVQSIMTSHLNLMICCIQFLFVFGAFFTDAQTESIKLYPNDPHLLVGDTLEMLCTIKSNQHRVEELVFLLSNPKEQHGANSSYVKIINSTTATFEYPNMKYGVNEVNCKRWSGIIGSGQKIRVGRLPSPIEILEEKSVWYNFERFTLCWKDNGNDIFPVNYTRVSFRTNPKYIPTGASYNYSIVCQVHPKRNSDPCCDIMISYDFKNAEDMYDFEFVSNYHLGEVSENLTLTIIKFLKPAPVKKVIITENPARVNIVASQEHTWCFELRVFCEKKKYMNFCAEGQPMITHDLINLPFYMSCNLSVKRQYTSDDDNFTEGRWSDEVTQNFVTRQSVPDTAPRICSTCFIKENKSVSPHNGLRSTTIVVKPQKKKELRGEFKAYHIKYWRDTFGTCHYQQLFWSQINSTAVEHLERNQTASFNLDLADNTSYCMVITTQTKMGINTTLLLTPLIIPKRTELTQMVKNFTVIKSSSENPTCIYNFNFNHQNVLKEQNYTISWRTKKQKTRKSSEYWSDADWINLNSLMLPHSQSLPCKLYQFGISTIDVHTGYSSGIELSRCTYIEGIPEQLRIDLKVINSTALALNLEKKQPQPSGECNEYIYGYNVNYTTCTSNCQPGDWSTKYLDSDTNNYVFTDLVHNSLYTFHVRALSVNGTSPSAVEQNSTPFSMSAGSLTAIIVGVLFLVALAIIGVIFCIKENRDLWKGSVIIVLPDVDRHHSTGFNDYVPSSNESHFGNKISNDMRRSSDEQVSALWSSNYTASTDEVVMLPMKIFTTSSEDSSGIYAQAFIPPPIQNNEVVDDPSLMRNDTKNTKTSDVVVSDGVILQRGIELNGSVLDIRLQQKERTASKKSHIPLTTNMPRSNESDTQKLLPDILQPMGRNHDPVVSCITDRESREPLLCRHGSNEESVISNLIAPFSLGQTTDELDSYFTVDVTSPLGEGIPLSSSCEMTVTQAKSAEEFDLYSLATKIYLFQSSKINAQTPTFVSATSHSSSSPEYAQAAWACDSNSNSLENTVNFQTELDTCGDNIPLQTDSSANPVLPKLDVRSNRNVQLSSGSIGGIIVSSDEDISLNRNNNNSNSFQSFTSAHVPDFCDPYSSATLMDEFSEINFQ